MIDSVKKAEADIGFVAYDPVRAVDVDFSQTYALAQNTYLVVANLAAAFGRRCRQGRDLKSAWASATPAISFSPAR